MYTTQYFQGKFDYANLPPGNRIGLISMVKAAQHAMEADISKTTTLDKVGRAQKKKYTA